MNDLYTSVQHIVLYHEDYVEEHGDEAKTEFNGVPVEGYPVGNIEALKNHLQNVQCSSGEVEQHIANRPSDGAFPLKIEKDLKFPRCSHKGDGTYFE